MTNKHESNDKPRPHKANAELIPQPYLGAKSFEELSEHKPIRNRKFTPDKQQAFLILYSHFGVISKSAQAVGVGYDTIARQLKSDPVFKKLFERAKIVAADTVEAEVFKRAVEGWEEPVWYQGEIVGHTLKKSDRMLELLAKGVRPDKFSEKMQLSGKGGGPLQLQVINFGETTREELDKIEEGEYIEQAPQSAEGKQIREEVDPEQEPKK